MRLLVFTYILTKCTFEEAKYLPVIEKYDTRYGAHLLTF
jgi:hypothetical protein